MNPVHDDDIEVIHMTAVEWDRALQASLDKLGLTWEQLAAQAAARDFSSLKAQQLWLMAGGQGPNQAATEVERLPVALEREQQRTQAALADRDQQFERRCEALRECDEARAQVAALQRELDRHRLAWQSARRRAKIRDEFARCYGRELNECLTRAGLAEHERDHWKGRFQQAERELAEARAAIVQVCERIDWLIANGFGARTADLVDLRAALDAPQHPENTPTPTTRTETP